ncbi:hypothetical protein HYDPIDRAFT_23178 [Hydnomerulius pinastri MD-312]|nr:hypothetical protein HYDPIDRAFT_23178 [Hydnomerulius pinastri MD-312]
MSHAEPARSMSHRKPVPKFIPSPPPSPPSSPGAPFRQISLSSVASGSPIMTDMPPLPEDWRDVIDRVVSRERRSTLPTINTVADFSVREGPSSDIDGEAQPLRQSPASMDFETTRSYMFAPPSPSESYDGEPVSRPDSPTPWMRPGGRRRGQTEYRPPTPPLPRQKSRSAESGCESPTKSNVTHRSRNSPSLPSPPLPALPLPSPPRPSRPLPEIPVQDVPPVHDIREIKPNVPLVVPQPSRQLLHQRDASLTTPPSSLSTHEYPVLTYQPGRDGSMNHPEYASSLGSTTPAHTRPPSTLYSEKWTERTTHAVTVKIEPPSKEASVEHTRAKVEALPAMLPAKPKPTSFRQALVQGLKRVSALVVSAFLCRS